MYRSQALFTTKTNVSESFTSAHTHQKRRIYATRMDWMDMSVCILGLVNNHSKRTSFTHACCLIGFLGSFTVALDVCVCVCVLVSVLMNGWACYKDMYCILYCIS